MDESNFMLMALVLQTWAVTGLTPILNHLLSHDKLSIIGSVDTNGRVLYYEHIGNITSQEVKEFLKLLNRKYQGEKLLVIWDGAPVHRSKEVRSFLQEQDDGQLWLKRHLANRSCKALWEVMEVIKEAIQQLRYLPELVKRIINGSPIMAFQ